MIGSRFAGQARIGLLLLCAGILPSCGGNSSPSPSASSVSSHPSVSQGGRFVVFQSSAPGATSQVVIVDRVNATSVAVGTNEDIANAAVTPDGRFVAFDAQPSGGGPRQVFLRDLTTGETTLISETPDGTPGSGNSTKPSLSDDARFVAFQSEALNLGAQSSSLSSVLVRDVTSRRILSASSSATGNDLNASMSGNSQFVGFESRPPSGSGFSIVFLWNRLTGQLTRVSPAEGAPPPNGESADPSLNFDGRFVAFESRATNLTPKSPDMASFSGESNILIRDVLTGGLFVASVPLHPGDPPDGDSHHPAISQDATRIAFDSTATNLTVEPVQSGESNVFVRDLETGITQLVTPAPIPAATPPAPETAVAPTVPAPIPAAETGGATPAAGVPGATEIPTLGISRGVPTSVPVTPIAPVSGLTTSAPVASPAPASVVPAAPPPETLVTPPGSGIPTIGVARGVPTAAPVPPTGTVSGLTTSLPVQPIAPVSGLTTSVPVQPSGTVSGLTTSLPVQPLAPVSGLTTSVPVQPIAPVSGLTTSTPVLPLGTVSTPVSGAPMGSASLVNTSTGVTVVINAAVPVGSQRPKISSDGSWVVFESRGRIFLANLQTGEITAIR